MKTEPSSSSVAARPVLTIEVFRDDNGNYFAELSQDGSVSWTATYTKIEEAAIAALAKAESTTAAAPQE